VEKEHPFKGQQYIVLPGVDDSLDLGDMVLLSDEADVLLSGIELAFLGVIFDPVFPV